MYQGNPRQSWILDRGFRIPGNWFQSLWVELGFWIPVVHGIPDSLNCIPDSKAQDSRFHKQNFPGFGNPDSLTWGDIPLNKTITAGHSSQSPINRNLYEKYLCVNTSLAVWDPLLTSWQKLNAISCTVVLPLHSMYSRAFHHFKGCSLVVESLCF